MPNQCPNCGASINGRVDKKFCSDYCRNTFNNKKNSDVNNYMRNVNNALRKNRRILATMNVHQKTKVPKKKLLQAGFNFEYYTNVYETRKGSKYFFCYDQGYLTIDDKFLTLVVKQDYV
jgi:predicted nucleic acid-binding Zn ribbon protein